MDYEPFAMDLLKHAPRWLRDRVERLLTSIPSTRRKIHAENLAALSGMEHELKPYRQGYLSFSSLPDQGASRSELLAEMQRMQSREQERWADGYASGAVY